LSLRRSGRSENSPDEERWAIPLGFFGKTPPFTKRQRRVFLIATTAGFFDQYDRALLTLALKQIQKGLQISEAALGNLLTLIRLGYIGSLLVTPMADVFGRRRLPALHHHRVHDFHRPRGNRADGALLRRMRNARARVRRRRRNRRAGHLVRGGRCRRARMGDSDCSPRSRRSASESPRSRSRASTSSRTDGAGFTRSR